MFQAASCKEEESAVRVLVTGFNDWKGLGSPPNVHICRENPSGRLLVGKARREAPDGKAEYEGELVERLSRHQTTRNGKRLEYEFRVLPTVWGTAVGLDRSLYDTVIHLGLGVYDRFDQIVLEHGAINMRMKAPDAAGNCPSTAHCSSRTMCEPGAVLFPSSKSAVSKKLQVMDGHTTSGKFEVCVAQARQMNSYICNETNFDALQAMNQVCEANGDSCRPTEAFFVHIPYPMDRDDLNYAKLADAVSEVIVNLVDDTPVSNSTNHLMSARADIYSNA